MAEEMKVKFSKYWEDYSIILAMVAILDPRMKFQILEKAYECVDPATSKSKAEKLKDDLKELYKDYQNRKLASSSRVPFSQTPSELVTESPLDDDFDKVSFKHFHLKVKTFNHVNEWFILLTCITILCYRICLS